MLQKLDELQDNHGPLISPKRYRKLYERSQERQLCLDTIAQSEKFKNNEEFQSKLVQTKVKQQLYEADKDLQMASQITIQILANPIFWRLKV